MGGDIACYAIVCPSPGCGLVFLDTATFTIWGSGRTKVTSRLFGERTYLYASIGLAFLRTFTLALALRRGLTIWFVKICYV